MYPGLDDCFPSIPSGSLFSAPKISESICIGLERYFQAVFSMCGRQLLMAVFFESSESDDYLCELYQESMSELKLKSLEDACEKSRIYLQEILQMREKCDNMLQLSSVYPLERDAVGDLMQKLSLYYEFHIQPFIDLRKVSHEKLNKVKEDPKKDMDATYKMKIREYQEQIMSADDSILNLRKEYLSRRIDIFSVDAKFNLDVKVDIYIDISICYKILQKVLLEINDILEHYPRPMWSL
ncbi:Junction-mediating and -regulatory protein [Nymphon striatum]|nr:Junction-mediating and -regulatory protein [Nymphon striatum]